MKTELLQIIPLIISKLNTAREKRGLINVLGPIIRSITGNLVTEDAAQYNKILN